MTEKHTAIPISVSETSQETVKAEEINHFQTEVDNILNIPLSPSNIDTYAESALTNLIELISGISKDYKRENSQSLLDGKNLEDAAFAYFGLGNLGQTLDHISTKAIEISNLNKLINEAEIVENVIIPPKDNIAIPQGENATFKPKSIISRTKTLLFILSNDFEVDLTNKDQLSLKTGILSDNMMRNLSYYLISIPKLDRTILVCDEEGNVTYIFDNKELVKQNITPDDLTKLTKNDINNLLENDTNLGQRVVYSTKFVPKMINLIQDVKATEKLQEENQTSSYLYPKATDEIKTIRSVAKNLGIAYSTVQNSIDELGPNLGVINKYRFGTNNTYGFTSEQYEKIKQHNIDRGTFAPAASIDVLSIYNIAQNLGIVSKTVQKVIDDLGLNLGVVNKYKFGVRITYGYTSDQYEKIQKYLEDRGKLATDAPLDVLSIRKVAKKIGVNYKTIQKAIDQLGPNLGKINEYRFGVRIANGYTFEQQETIRQFLKSNGLFIEKATQEIKSTRSIAKKLGMDTHTVQKAVDKLGLNLGKVSKYKFGANVTYGFTSEQYELILQQLISDGRISNETI